MSYESQGAFDSGFRGGPKRFGVPGYGNRSALRQYGLGDDESDVIPSTLLNLFNTVKTLQETNLAKAEAEANAKIAALGGAKPVAPITTTTTGSTSPSAVTSNDFIPQGNVCKAKNAPALTAAKELQIQLNRIARKKGLGTLTVDGQIGPATVELTKKVKETPAGLGCLQFSGDAVKVTASLRAFADSIGAPPPTQSELVALRSAGVITVQTRLPSGAPGPTQTFKPPGASASIMDVVKNMSDTAKIALGGVALLGGLFVFKKLRKGRGGGGTALAAPKPMLALPAAGATSNPRRRRRRRR